MPKRKTKAEFIQRAKSKHGDKYDYSNSIYVDKRTQLEIICPVHGSFFQNAGAHMEGKGCLKCANELKLLTLDQFLFASRRQHGDKYDYSLVDYKHGQTKVKIVCPSHGIFLSRPQNHMKGRGCAKCAHDRARRTQSSFIADAIQVHGDTYDYSLVEYVSFSHKVKIKCKTHGVFTQTPRGHIGRGDGCPQCSGRMRKTLAQFIENAKSVHGCKYDYSKAKYINTDSKLEIGCPIHGWFWQTPHQHIKRGNGCPQCANNGLDYSKPTYLYLLFFQKPIANFWKVGITNLSIHQRFYDHRFITRRYLWLFCDGWHAEAMEKTILKSFSGYSLPPNPQLTKSGYTECFVDYLPVDIALVFIDSMAKRINLTSD
jgi:hypothetical protein